MAEMHRELAVAPHDAQAAKQAIAELRRADAARKGRGAWRGSWRHGGGGCGPLMTCDGSFGAPRESGGRMSDLFSPLTGRDDSADAPAFSWRPSS